MQYSSLVSQVNKAIAVANVASGPSLLCSTRYVIATHRNLELDPAPVVDQRHSDIRGADNAGRRSKYRLPCI